MARPEKVRLGEILLQQKVLTEEQLRLALAEQKESGRKLGQVLIANGYVSEDDICRAMTRQLNIPYINLKTYNLNPEVVRQLPEMRARRYRALVLEDRGNSALVGMADPTDLFVYDEIARLLKKDIELAVVAEEALFQAISRIYRKTEEISDAARELKQEVGETQISFSDAGGVGLEEAPVVRLLQTIFDDASQVQASDVHIEPQESALHIRLRIDGVMHLQTETDLRIAAPLALRLKIMAGLDISEKRLPQDGRFNIRVGQQQIDVRMSTMPTKYGESVVMRLLNQSRGILGLDVIGMPESMLKRFREIIHRPNGLVLVTGPTGSGKTTTLYGALSELNTSDRKLITIEDPVEYKLPGINQVQVNDKIDLTFARVLRASLRQDPDVVLIGEMRDEETAQVGMRAALTGHLVFSTLHTNDAISTPNRLLDMGVPGYILASALQVVMAQRLVRLICDACSEPCEPSVAEREWLKATLGDGAAQTYAQGRGCPHCNGSGYRGRIGVYEMLEMTEALADIASREDHAGFIQAAERQMAGLNLRRHAAELARQGRTTIAEAMTVSNQAVF
ncbi:MSHA biogenesis protein MshE [Noviherbaspirillum humi]|uniref:MSHA biogenesis protein MshE n=1 Tax=Noviherbaspirillum humi TaxID=1688639 RepID=A0A239HN09_9BURK|nr:GspE/PulE family protein [Noviherbaspirillum humi]SNS82712.1 MSHA biogenesis protein MshE [Noviherbaspirillum humi]